MSTKKTTIEEVLNQEPMTEKEIKTEAARLKEEVEAIMRAAREEAARIITGAKEAVAELDKAKTAEVATSDPKMEELVPVMLFKDSDKYKEDVFVAVNGETCLIQRGKPVQIKRKFALVLEQSQTQDMATADMIAGLTNEYKIKEQRLAE